MSYYHEFEYYLDEFMDGGLGYTLFANLGSTILSIAAYVLTALALYTLAQRRGIKNPWLSWIPVVNCWIVGSLSDQYRYVVRGEVKNKRKTLLILNIVNAAIAVAEIVLVIVVAVVGISGLVSGRLDATAEEMIIAPVIIAVLLCLPLIGVSIATAVVHYMAMYDIYTSCNPNNSVVFLVLSIIFHITEPFFLFFARNRDEGMPPRRQQAVYEEPRAPWDNPEYL